MTNKFNPGDKVKLPSGWPSPVTVRGFVTPDRDGRDLVVNYDAPNHQDGGYNFVVKSASAELIPSLFEVGKVYRPKTGVESSLTTNRVRVVDVVGDQVIGWFITNGVHVSWGRTQSVRHYYEEVSE